MMWAKKAVRVSKKERITMGIKQKGSNEKVFVFVGDMSFESGIFYEVHKYARNFDLPIVFVVEDNGVSTYTPTEATWNTKREVPSDVIYYTYKSYCCLRR